MKRRRSGGIVWLLGGFCAATAAIVFSSAHVIAKPGVIKTKDGQTYAGELDESNPETIVVTTGRIPTAVPRDRIASIEYAEDFAKKFRDRLSKLDAQDVQGRLELAREAMAKRQYVLAREAAESARLIDPNNTEAVALVDTSQNLIKMERMQQQPPPQPPAAGAPGAGAAGAAGAPATQSIADRLLKPEQINAIRQAELRPEDVGIRIRFDRDVKKRFMEYQALTHQEINAMPVSDLVQRILKEGTPEMRRDVIIQNDPPPLLEYRRSIQPFILNNCATSGCHGPVNPQKLSLLNPADNDAAVYTNFYILQTYRKKLPTSGDNVFGRGELRMIDRQAPRDSMLLQYALPGAIAEFDHPDVSGYRPPLRSLNDPRYLQIRNWIGDSLITVPRDYGFTLESDQPATQPAPAPATAPMPATAPVPAGRPRMTPPVPATRPTTRPPFTDPTRPPTAAPPAPPAPRQGQPQPQPPPATPRTPFQRPNR